MSYRIKVKEKILPRIKDTSKTMQTIEPKEIMDGLGAEEIRTEFQTKRNPISLMRLPHKPTQDTISTEHLALENAAHRQKIPLQDSDQEQLHKLMAALADRGFQTTPGQVAGMLLHRMLSSFSTQDLEKQLRENTQTFVRQQPIQGNVIDFPLPQESFSLAASESNSQELTMASNSKVTLTWERLHSRVTLRFAKKLRGKKGLIELAGKVIFDDTFPDEYFFKIPSPGNEQTLNPRSLLDMLKIEVE